MAAQSARSTDRPIRRSISSPRWAPAGAVTFFMFLMFWVPHKGQPVPVFEDIMAAFMAGSLPMQVMIGIALAGIAFFSVMHIRLLVWNMVRLNAFHRSEHYEAFKESNGETQMKAVPLTLAMTINVGFILGLVFVPHLWSVVEYLFPLAIVAFVAVGIYAMRLLASFFGRVLVKGGFNLEANNSFAQLLPAFALSMVAVGLAAPAAMSDNAVIVAVAHTMATFFMVAAVTVSIVALVLGFYSMMQHGTAPEAAPTLMIIIPIMTVLGIALLRLGHGLHVHFDVHAAAGDTLVMLTRMLSLQVLFGLLGLLVLKRQNYFATYLSDGGRHSPGTYALVCPGVALSVMIHFFVNKGLVAAGLIAKFGIAYWAFTAPALVLQVLMIWLVLRLNRQHMAEPRRTGTMVPAE